MKRQIYCQLIVLVAMFVSPQLSVAQTKDKAGEKTLERTKIVRRRILRKYDQVVVKGVKLFKIMNRKIEDMRLMAVKGKELETIPFQIDERTPSGTYAFDKGTDTKKDNDSGRLDGNDELVFMSRDCGHRATTAMLADKRLYHEIELLDPKNQRMGWVYIIHFRKDAPKKSTADYVSVSYNTEKGLLKFRGKDFETSNSKSTGNAVRTTSMRFFRKDGSFSPNNYDTTKTRVDLQYFGVNVSRNGTEMRVTLGAYIDGPVRVVASNIVQIYLVWGFWLSAPNSLIFLYDYGSEMPSNINVPVNLDAADPPSVARLSTDHRASSKNLFFYNSHNKAKVAIDGRMSPAERKLDKTFPDWNVTFSPDGGVVTRFIFKNKMLQKKKYSGLFYIDDKNRDDSPDNEKGSIGNVGFQLDLSGIPKKIYKGTYYTYYKAYFRYGDEQPFLDIVNKPIKLTVR